MGCVVPDEQSDDASVPAYVWAAIIIGLLLFALVVIILVYVLRNTDTFKILASTRASVQSGCGAGTRVGVASAPELPPPYNAHYSAVRPSSPPHDMPPQYNLSLPNGEESSRPFIKRTPSEYGDSHGGVRESAGSQAAHVYNNPNYVRGPQIPPNYEAPGVMPASTPSAEFVVASDEEADAFVHDEDTMESSWTPSVSPDVNANAPSVASGELSAQLKAARDTALVRAPRSYLACGWQDTNNNRNGGESMGSAEGGGAPSTSGGPSVIINLVQSFSAVQHAPPHRHNEPS